MSEVIIDGCNVAECDKYCKFDNRNEPNKCYSYISEGYSDCKPKEYQCLFYVEEIEKQLQRAKAELEQYKKSKQASYESMQVEWNNAVNELRDVKAENEKLKEKLNAALKNNANITELKLENEELKAYMKVNQDFQKAWQKLNSMHNDLQQVYQDEHCDNLKYKQALEEIRDIVKPIKDNTCFGMNCGAIDWILNEINEVLNES